jgi:hypothetical protein
LLAFCCQRVVLAERLSLSVLVRLTIEVPFAER